MKTSTTLFIFWLLFCITLAWFAFCWHNLGYYTGYQQGLQDATPVWKRLSIWSPIKMTGNVDIEPDMTLVTLYSATTTLICPDLYTDIPDSEKRDCIPEKIEMGKGVKLK